MYSTANRVLSLIRVRQRLCSAKRKRVMSVRMRTLTMSTRRRKRSNAGRQLQVLRQHLPEYDICRPSVDCPADFVTCSTPMSRSPGLSGRVELHFTLVRARADKRLDDLRSNGATCVLKKVPEPSRQTEVHRFVCVRYPSSFALGSTLRCILRGERTAEQPQNGTNGSKLSNTARLTIAPQDFLIRNSFGDCGQRNGASGYAGARNTGAGDTDRQVWQGGLFF
jgi:hypothetical protein